MASRLASILAQIDYDLLHLRGVGKYRPGSRTDTANQSDIIREEGLDHVEGSWYNIGQRQSHLVLVGCPAELEYLPDYALPALAGTASLFESGALRIVLGQSVEHEFQRTKHDGQNVVELVRRASGKLALRFVSLRLL